MSAINLTTQNYGIRVIKITNKPCIEQATVQYNGLDYPIQTIEMKIKKDMYHGEPCLALYVDYKSNAPLPNYLGNLIVSLASINYDGTQFRFNPDQVKLNMANYPSSEYTIRLTPYGSERLNQWLARNGF